MGGGGGGGGVVVRVRNRICEMVHGCCLVKETTVTGCQVPIFSHFGEPFLLSPIFFRKPLVFPFLVHGVQRMRILVSI